MWDQSTQRGGFGGLFEYVGDVLHIISVNMIRHKLCSLEAIHPNLPFVKKAPAA